MSTQKSEENAPAIRVEEKFSEAFERLEQQIRERAYHLSRSRLPGVSDSLSDWLEAQSEFASAEQLEVKEQRKNIVVEGKLKGFAPDDIEVEVAGDCLRVFGSHRETSSDEEAGESSSSQVSFYQSVQLPAPVVLEGSRAKVFKNGKLKVTLPRKTPLKQSP